MDNSEKEACMKDDFVDVEEALTELRSGRALIIVTDGDGESEDKKARLRRLVRMARRYGMRVMTRQNLIASRIRTEKRIVRRVSEARLPTDLGEFRMIVYKSLTEPELLHFTLLKGDPRHSEAPLVRLHSECLTGESLHSVRCDCGYQLRESMRRVQKEGGIIVYLRQEGRGIGFANKIRAYNLQDQGYDTVDANLLLGFAADQRDYTFGAKILEDLGVRKVRLLTNNPDKITGLEACGIKVEERIPLVAEMCRENELYLSVKKRRLGHLLDMVEESTATRVLRPNEE
jgi:3,4-dihydroxy 2-butanone 4-phosphate synthase/GTP cyclohydrolase II